MAYKNSIVSNPEILNGKPVIAGTRIPISQILFLLKEGNTLPEIQAEYPNISIKKLQGVLEELTTRLEIKTNGSQVPQI